MEDTSYKVKENIYKVKRGCLSKKRFDTFGIAKDFLKRLNKFGIGDGLYPYSCKYCHGYHLGHKRRMHPKFNKVKWVIIYKKKGDTSWVRKNIFDFEEYLEAVNHLREMKYTYPDYNWRMKRGKVFPEVIDEIPVEETKCRIISLPVGYNYDMQEAN